MKNQSYYNSWKDLLLGSIADSRNLIRISDEVVKTTKNSTIRALMYDFIEEANQNIKDDIKELLRRETERKSNGQK